MMNTFKVGDVVTSPSADEVIFDITDSGPVLLLKMSKPTSTEKNNFKNGVPQFRMAIANDIIFILSRFGTSQWCDAPYYALRSAMRAPLTLPDVGAGLALHAMLIDARTGMLVAQRLIGLPHDLSVRLLDAAAKQGEIANYDDMLALTMARYPTQALLEIAEG